MFFRLGIMKIIPVLGRSCTDESRHLLIDIVFFPAFTDSKTFLFLTMKMEYFLIYPFETPLLKDCLIYPFPMPPLVCLVASINLKIKYCYLSYQKYSST